MKIISFDKNKNHPVQILAISGNYIIVKNIELKGCMPYLAYIKDIVWENIKIEK
jgi:hypothetical protein